TDRIKVTSSDDVTITINSININNAGNSNIPFEINASGDVTIKLSGTNVLIAGTNTNNAALQNTSRGTLIITSSSGDGSTSGSLTAAGGYYGAGIGGGKTDSSTAEGGSTGANSGGTITIKGGTITASSVSNGAGIGGSSAGGGAGTITINGGKVTVTSVDNSGIGGSGGSITITGGTVTAESTGKGAGIGTGSSGTVEISGGTVTATGGEYGAGIGGGSGGTGGTIVISAGTVTAVSTANGAGIGGGNGSSCGTITISGGTVTATSNGPGSGIGGGVNASGGTVNISGGTVVAKSGSNGAGIGGGKSGSSGGTITITGGKVTATATTYGAGIGGGGDGTSSGGGNGGIINISAGTVEATGGSYGAGIGGGYYGAGGTITISGGEVTATAASGDNAGAGIGGGRNGDSGTITISGDDTVVNVTGGRYSAGIGSGYMGGSSGTITINGGTVTAASISAGAGIGGGQGSTGGTIKITGGTVIAKSGNGAGIGGGKATSGGSITITGGTITAAVGNSVGGAGIGGGGNGDSSSSSGGGDGGTINISGGYILISSGSNKYIGAGNGGSNDGTITITGGYYGTGDVDADTVYSASVYTGYSVANNIEDTKETYPYLVTKTGITYTVTFELGDATLSNYDNPATYYFGTGLMLPKESDLSGITAGYDFAGWYMDSDYSGEAVTLIGTDDAGNIILYAKVSCSHSTYKDGFCTVCGYYEPAYWNESGYEIGNPGQLLWFAALVNGDTSSGLVEFTDDDTARGTSANAVLTADIDMGSYGSLYVPIGRGNALYKDSGNVTAVTEASYKGTFDGQGHVISNLTVSAVTTNDIGIFGSLSGTVKNLGVCNFSNTAVTDGARGGAIVGQIIQDGFVENCYVQNSVVNCAGKVAGGLAGANYGGTVENCYVVNTTVTATRTGSIVGDNEEKGSYVGTVANCYTDGNYLATSNSSYCGTVSGGEASVSTSRFASGEIAWLLQEGQDDESPLVWGQGLTVSTDSYPILTSTSTLRVMKVEFYLVTDGIAATEASATVYVNNGSTLASDSYPATGETGYEYLFYTDSSCEDGYQIITSSHTYNYDSGEATETVYMKKVSAAAYTVTIPATATLGGTITVSATGVTVSSGKSLVVKLTGTSETDNAFKVRNLTDNGDIGTGVLSYTLTKGETGSEESVTVGDTILSVAGGTTDGSGSVQLNFGTPTDTPQFAGEYTGTVTFTVSVETDSG
ncbi:MAG: InlB B-repeat-containing protein, partial [Lachnospiraceae bacterium]|nr:InlB B-repeat-containing protein [Lachnospiraceae bacterium]